jgi:hypothetical protein
MYNKMVNNKFNELGLSNDILWYNINIESKIYEMKHLISIIKLYLVLVYIDIEVLAIVLMIIDIKT